MGLYKFRILELTTNSGKKKYKPQALMYTQVLKNGMWWWLKSEKTISIEDWCSFYCEPDNTYMYNYKRPDRGELIFDTIEEAKEAIQKFEIDMKEFYANNNDKTFKNEVKIIDVE